MSNWALQGGSRVAVGGSLATYGGLLLPEPAAANSLTPWTELVAATPVPAAGLLVACWSGYGGGKRGLLDLAVGAGGVERMLVEGLPLAPGPGAPEAMGVSAPLFLPLSVAAGERIAARWQVSANAGTGLSKPDLMIHLLPPHPFAPAGATFTETHGLDRPASGGTAVTSAAGGFGPWVQLGTLTRHAFALIPCILGGTTSSPRLPLLVEFGIGGAPNQTTVAQQSTRLEVSNQVSYDCLGHVFVDAPAGTALWARVAAATVRNITCHIIALS